MLASFLLGMILVANPSYTSNDSKVTTTEITRVGWTKGWKLEVTYSDGRRVEPCVFLYGEAGSRLGVQTPSVGGHVENTTSSGTTSQGQDAALIDFQKCVRKISDSNGRFEEAVFKKLESSLAQSGVQLVKLQSEFGAWVASQKAENAQRAAKDSAHDAADDRHDAKFKEQDKLLKEHDKALKDDAKTDKERDEADKARDEADKARDEADKRRDATDTQQNIQLKLLMDKVFGGLQPQG